MYFSENEIRHRYDLSMSISKWVIKRTIFGNVARKPNDFVGNVDGNERSGIVAGSERP